MLVARELINDRCAGLRLGMGSLMIRDLMLDSAVTFCFFGVHLCLNKWLFIDSLEQWSHDLDL